MHSKHLQIETIELDSSLNPSPVFKEYFRLYHGKNNFEESIVVHPDLLNKSKSQGRKDMIQLKKLLAEPMQTTSEGIPLFKFV
jgi:hypothetical protein